MGERLHVRVVTPENPVHEGEADLVVVPAHDGEVGIMPRHARFLAKLGAGALRVVQDGVVLRWFLESGFVQVADNRVTVLCERATALSELDADAAEAAALQARESLDPAARELTRRAEVIRRVAQSAGGSTRP